MDDPYADEPYADEPTPVAALGAVVESGRGSLPFALIHGEALVACASWALGEAGVTAVDLTVAWEDVVAADEPFVLHDPLCPMTPAAFIASCVRTAHDLDRVVVGVRPVTDTVKVLHPAGQDGDVDLVGETLDRDVLWSVVSPVVLPASVVAALDRAPGTDLVALVAALGERWPVETVVAPAQARRVASTDDVRLLEALTER